MLLYSRHPYYPFEASVILNPFVIQVEVWIFQNLLRCRYYPFVRLFVIQNLYYLFVIPDHQFVMALTFQNLWRCQYYPFDFQLILNPFVIQNQNLQNPLIYQIARRFVIVPNP